MENSAVTLESCITQSDEKQPTPDTVLLMELEENDLLLSKIEFDCAICLDKVEIGEGVILRECFHQFCRYTTFIFSCYQHFLINIREKLIPITF